MSDDSRIGDLLAANANLILELDAALSRIATLERQVAELQAKRCGIEALPTQGDLATNSYTASIWQGHHIIGPHQPCHTFTAETGQPDADEPTIVEAKP